MTRSAPSKESEAGYLAQLENQVAELSRSNEELRQFATIAAHDLQEPLRTVGSYTQLLARRYKGQLDEDADEFIYFVVDGVGRMQRLIHGLLTRARAESTGSEGATVSGEDALRQALANLREAIAESGARVTHNALPTVAVDGMELVQILQNLVGNSIKFRGTGIPEVHVSAFRKGREWIFSVKDNGLGIAPRDFEKIFGMFERLREDEGSGGTGIGLAVYKKIVERQGGRIWVTSLPGHGATFRFTLPGVEGR